MSIPACEPRMVLIYEREDLTAIVARHATGQLGAYVHAERVEWTTNRDGREVVEIDVGTVKADNQQATGGLRDGDPGEIEDEVGHEAGFAATPGAGPLYGVLGATLRVEPDDDEPDVTDAVNDHAERCAYTEGLLAGRKGEGEDACPYNLRRLRSQWLDGWGCAWAEGAGGAAHRPEAGEG